MNEEKAKRKIIKKLEKQDKKLKKGKTMGILYSKREGHSPDLKLGNLVAIIIVFVTIVTILGMAVLPIYGVWQRGLEGEAQLQEATWNRQIAIEEAEARLKSAKLDAMSEVERAYGVAEANTIIGGSLENNTGYLHYLWIQGLHDDNSEVIYIPTEMNLPIMKEI